MVSDRVYQLRRKGHELIQNLGEYGLSKNECYAYIHKRLGGNPKFCHFSEIYSQKKLHQAIEALEGMLAEIVDKTAKSR